MFLQILVSVALGYLGWSLVCMEINYRRASAMGIPLIRLAIDVNNVPWMMLEPHLWPLLDRLPINWGSFGLYSRRGYHFADKADSHIRYGPMWALVTPVDVYIHVADPDAVNEIFSRRTHFLRPSKMYKLLEVYGPCISTASLTDWPRHRKVLAAPFNENIMTFVWDQAIEQSHQMLDIWTNQDTQQIPSVSKDTRTLSLNILAATGFRQSYKFQSSKSGESGESGNYRDALQTVLDNCIMLMIISPKLLGLPFAPERWHRVSKAAADFKDHMVTMLDDETAALNEGKPGSGGLMASFVRALKVKQQVDSEDKNSPSTPKGLTVDEIFGNIFVINFAGHDTTANTLAFAMLLLAAHPEVQDWVAEEVQQLAPISEERDYDSLFPKLKRCKAIMFETLRLYPPIMGLPKWSNDQPQSLQVGDRTIIIPSSTGIAPGVLALQTHPKYWTDPLVWKPTRWISTTAAPDSDMITTLQNEVFLTPRKGTYFPWSDGPQNCPGNKFSQVEFVAVMMCLLRNHRISAIQNPGERFKDTRERIMNTTNDVNMEMLLRMKNADNIQLMCKQV